LIITASAMFPGGSDSHSPIVLVHGAANSAYVFWKFWQRELAARGWPTYAIDLRGHGNSDPADLSHTSMNDYADDVYALVRQLRRKPILVGWSMGGLIAMMVASSGHGAACVALAPSLPARQPNPSIELRTGEFTAEEYGILNRDPEEQPAMPDLDLEERKVALSSLSRESRLARDERRRGIVIEALPCPLLIVTGTLDEQWPNHRYDDLWLRADRLSVEGASHWGLVLNKRALAKAIPEVLNWIETSCGLIVLQHFP